jgi:Rrf2 family nitric oxide-sensitive transcriptional repressor
MHLSKFSDYALRLLLLAASRPGQMITIREAAETYAISQAHLKKVVMLLARRGYLVAARGHGGGFTLATPPEAINLGAVVRQTEPNFAIFACYTDPDACVISSHCALPGAFDRALAAFLAELDRYTLRDFQLAPGAFGAPTAARAARTGAAALQS